MTKTNTAARRKRAPIWLAALMLAGISTLTAVPAQAAPMSAPSVAREMATQARAASLASVSSGPAAFFGLGPASAKKIDNRPYFAWGVTPGASLKDYVAVVNFGAQPVTVQVFASNAVSLAHGGTGFLSQGQILGGPASWITLYFPTRSSAVYLPPRSQVIVPITVQVPKNAPPGDHVGAIIASLTSSAVAKNHAKVHLVEQVAARAVIRVSGPLHPRLSVSGLSVEYNDPLNPAASNAATLRFTVRNTGNVLLGGKESVSVHGLFGEAKTVTGPQIPIMLPGGSTTEAITVRGVYPELLMHGDVTITPLIITGQDDPGLRTYSGSVTFWAVPWIPLAIVILIVLLIGAYIWRRRRRRHPAPGGAAPLASKTGVEA
jgi:WxL interacting protein linking bacterial and host surfaces